LQGLGIDEIQTFLDAIQPPVCAVQTTMNAGQPFLDMRYAAFQIVQIVSDVPLEVAELVPKLLNVLQRQMRDLLL